MSDFHNKQNFMNKFTRMIDAFPSLKSPSRIERIYSFMSELDENALVEIFNSIIDNFKSTPTPNDFAEAVNVWKKNYRIRTGFNYGYQFQKDVIQENNCKWCHDTGILKIQHNEDKSSFSQLMRCSCVVGKLNNCKMPQWDFSLSAGFKKIALDEKWFNPHIQETDSDEKIENKIWVKVEEWKKQIRRSEEYWINQGYLKGGA